MESGRHKVEMTIKMISILLLSLIASASVIFNYAPVFAEGGGGIECPEISGVYSYIPGSVVYHEIPFGDGHLGVLFCEYETESEGGDIDPFAEINAVFHTSGELNQDIIDEYGCGEILGEQYSPTYISSTTHFASVAFSTDDIIEVAENIMTQIEQQNLATLCNKDSSIEVRDKTIDEETKMDKSIPIKPEDFQVVLPDWIKSNAELWASGQITDDDFSLGIEFMITEGFIKVPPTEEVSEASDEIPVWIKNNAGWWAGGLISDSEFVNGIQFLISIGTISVTSN